MLTVKVCKQTQTERDIQTDEQISDIMQTVIPFRSMIMVKEEKTRKAKHSTHYLWTIHIIFHCIHTKRPEFKTYIQNL